MITASFPLIHVSLLLLTATMGMVLYARTEKQVRIFSLAGTLGVLMLNVLVLLNFDFSIDTIQFYEQISIVGLVYRSGVDAVGMLFYSLISTLSVLLLVFILHRGKKPDRMLLAGVLAGELVLLGLVTSLNLVQFWFWLAAEIIPLRILSGTGHSRHRAMQPVFLRYWILMLVLLLAGLITLGLTNTPGDYSVYDLAALTAPGNEIASAGPVFLLLFFGFAIRLPLFPFHGWLPVMAAESRAIPALYFLGGIKIGLFGLYRFTLPLLPDDDSSWLTFIEILAVFSIFYGALLALMQININRLLAFAIVSHSGMIVLGLFTLNQRGVDGSLLLGIAYGLATAGMILCSGFIHRKTGNVHIPRLGNLFEQHMFTAVLFLLAALSTMAIPGTPGYSAAHLLLAGIIEENGWLMAIVILTGNVLAAAFLLRAFQQIFIAKSRSRLLNRHASTREWRGVEVIICSFFCLLLLASGFYPLAGLLQGSI